MGKAKLNIPMCAALVLLLLTMISIHLTSGLCARYVATAGASDSARVAKFQVVSDVQNGIVMECALKDTPGGCEITVKNESEVAVSYTIVVRFAEEVPGTDLCVKLDESGTNQYVTADNSVTFNNVQTLAPNGAEAAHTLYFQVANWHAITPKLENGEWKLDFTVDIIARQVD